MLSKTNKRKTHKKRKKLFGVVALVCIVIAFFAGVVYVSRTFFGISLVSPIPLDTSFNLPSRNTTAKTTEVERFLKENDIPYQSVRIASDSSILVSLTENGDVYLSQENYPEELTTLQVIVSKITMEGKRFSRLDLRFERPVIVMP